MQKSLPLAWRSVEGIVMMSGCVSRVAVVVVKEKEMERWEEGISDTGCHPAL